MGRKTLLNNLYKKVRCKLKMAISDTLVIHTQRRKISEESLQNIGKTVQDHTATSITYRRNIK